MTALVVAVVAVVLLVLLLGAGALLLQRLRRQAAAAGHSLGEELAQHPPVHGPAEAEYAGGTGGGPSRRTHGVLVLTRDRLLFREVAGPGLDLVREELQDVSVEGNFDGLRPAPRRRGEPAPVHLVVRSRSGVAGFVVDDPEAWAEAVRGPLDGPEVSPG